MTAAAPRRKLPSWVPQALGYCLSAVCLAWVLHGYPLNQLIPAIRSLDWWWVTAAVLCDLSVYIVHGIRWNTLLEPVAKLSLWRTVQSIYIGLFANEVLPLRVGELIRCYLLAHWNGLNLSVAFASAGPDTAVTALTASSGGFTAAGQFGATGQAGAAIWTSASGTNWTAAPISGLTGGGNHTVTTLAPSGSAVTGIDAILTQQGQQYVTVALPAR